MRRLLAGMAITTIVALSACWAHADDQQIAQQIVQKLRQQKASGQLVGFGIDLEVDSGIVWLKGHVASRQQHKLVVDIARHTADVKQVVNDLQVKSTSAATPPVATQPRAAANSSTDQQPTAAQPTAAQPTAAQPTAAKRDQPTTADTSFLQAAADSKLLQKPKFMLSNLNQSVKRAFTYKPRQSEAVQEIGSSLARLASHSAKKEKPAKQEKPAPQRPATGQRTTVAKATAVTETTGPTDASIAELIIDRLRGQKSKGKLRNFDVDVQVNQGVVWVSGRVASADQQKLVLDISRRVPGAKQVVNDLRVSHSAPVQTASMPLEAPEAEKPSPQVAKSPTPREASVPVPVAPVSNAAPRRAAAPAPFVQSQTQERAQANAQHQAQAQAQARAQAHRGRATGAPLPFAPARSVQYNQVAPGHPQAMGGPRPIPEMQGAGGVARARYDHPSMPGYSWPSYAAYPNYGAVTYPRQYSPTAWPYIGPFYPYPQVPLGWRKVTLEWDDGWWNLDFKSK